MSSLLFRRFLTISCHPRGIGSALSQQLHYNWQVENVSLEIMEEAYSLPDTFHADPADRIITATARLND